MAFSIGDSIKAGWEIFKSRPWIFIGAILVLFIVSMIASSIIGMIDVALFGAPEIPQPGEMPTMPPMRPLAGILNFIISMLISMGAMSFFLKGHDNPQTVSLGDLWHPESLLSFIGTYILVAIVVAIGLILFVIPGIILALMLMFALWFVIDRGLGPIEAMKASNEITRGHKWQLLGFLIVLWLINLVGALALGIGLLVTVPVTVLSIIEAYRRLGG